MIQILHNPQCSKSNCALDALKAQDLDFQILDYLGQPLSVVEIQELVRKTGLPAEALVRKTEPLFREKYEGRTLSEEEWIAVMAEYPVLIQRPIIISGNKAVIARPLERMYDLIK
jgi:arsenate reductase